MKEVLKLIRTKHYIKNLLIFLPIIFSKNMSNINFLIKTVLAFLIFSLAASIIYIFNDIRDAEKDRMHPIKKNRPIASGSITKRQAVCVMVVFLLVCMVMSVLIFRLNLKAYAIVITYIIINFAYSYKLKNIPILDFTIVASGYLLRVLYGAVIIDVPVSHWLYLTILSISFYMAIGKRRNEISNNVNEETKDTREVLKYYTNSFLDKNMYMSLSLAIMFYSLWCVDINSQINGLINPIYTIPIVILISMRYSLNIEKTESTGDPVEIILKDKVIIALLILLCIMLGVNYI